MLYISKNIFFLFYINTNFSFFSLSEALKKKIKNIRIINVLQDYAFFHYNFFISKSFYLLFLYLLKKVDYYRTKRILFVIFPSFFLNSLCRFLLKPFSQKPGIFFIKMNIFSLFQKINFLLFNTLKCINISVLRIGDLRVLNIKLDLL